MKLIPEQSLWWELAEYLPWARNAESLPRMIVEGLQIVLEISCLSAIWISDDHNGSVSLQHKKTCRSFQGISSRGMNCMTESHSFHMLSPSCMLACILCALSFLGLHCIGVHSDMAASRMALFCKSLWWVLCWIFLLITQCGIFTTMIVEGLRKNLEMFWLSLECSVPEMAGKGFWVWQDAKDASQSRVLECLACFPSATA